MEFSLALPLEFIIALRLTVDKILQVINQYEAKIKSIIRGDIFYNS